MSVRLTLLGTLAAIAGCATGNQPPEARSSNICERYTCVYLAPDFLVFPPGLVAHRRQVASTGGIELTLDNLRMPDDDWMLDSSPRTIVTIESYRPVAEPDDKMLVARGECFGLDISIRKMIDGDRATYHTEITNHQETVTETRMGAPELQRIFMLKLEAHPDEAACLKNLRTSASEARGWQVPET